MSSKKGKRLRITERDFLLANRKAAREEEILAHGKPVVFRCHLHRSKKKYDRKQLKKTITPADDGFSFLSPNHRPVNNSSEPQGVEDAILRKRQL